MPAEEMPIGPDEAALLTDPVPVPGEDGELRPIAAKATPAPVEEPARLDAVDVLRGVALLGILAMNIALFGWPYVVYHTPIAMPGYGWADLALWMVNHVVFDEKMMTIFSMLFGAGLVLMSERAEARGARLAKVYYRRIVILLGIGLIHAYGIWEGDILVMYALCGLFLYPFRRRSAATLVALGVLLLAMAVPAWLIGRAWIRGAREATARVEAREAAGQKPDPDDARTRDFWDDILNDTAHTPEGFAKEVRAHRGGYARVAASRFGGLLVMHTAGFALGFWWLVGGRMFLGMGLMKLGVFSAARSLGFYRRLMALGYGLGLPLVVCDIAIDWYYEFFTKNPLWYFTGGWWLIQEASSPLLALGHVGLVMLVYRSGLVPHLMRRLAAVGRMALTNYLLTSLICTTLFYGYGLGLYARLHRPALYLVVLAVWSFQLAVSLPWLARFRYGPAEWGWRSLTYGRAQPFRIARKSSPPPQESTGELREVAPALGGGEIADEIGRDAHA